MPETARKLKLRIRTNADAIALILPAATILGHAELRLEIPLTATLSPATIVCMKLKVVIEPGEDRGFIVHVPALPGCRSQGATREDALANVREAIEAWLEVEQDKSDASGCARDVELITI